MTRMSILFVSALLISSTSTMLVAQQQSATAQKCTASKCANKNCKLENCPKCCVAQTTTAKACPHCAALQPAVVANPYSNFDALAFGAVAGSTALPGSMTLPGSTSFLAPQIGQRESSRQRLENDRAQLATQLTQYLTSGPRDPQHIRQVLGMALESTADEAQRLAMVGFNEPLPTPMPMVMPLPPARSAPLKKPAAAPLSNEMQALQNQQAEMGQLISLLQKDLQKIAEDLSQLHVESRINHRNDNHVRPTGITWPSQEQQQNMPRPQRLLPPQNRLPVYQQQSRPQQSRPQQSRPQSNESAEQLKLRIRVLENQLQQMNQQMRTSVQPGLMMGNRSQTPMRLQPMESSLTPLAPANDPMMQQTTVTYYVGDLMQPPFVNATLQLMQYIKSQVEPESWGHSAMMQIAEPSISLVITQTRGNQEKIAELLQQVRTGSRSYKESPGQMTRRR